MGQKDSSPVGHRQMGRQQDRGEEFPLGLSLFMSVSPHGLAGCRPFTVLSRPRRPDRDGCSAPLLTFSPGQFVSPQRVQVDEIRMVSSSLAWQSALPGQEMSHLTLCFVAEGSVC